MIAKFKEELEELDGKHQQLYETSVFLGKMLIAGAFFQLIITLYPNTYSFQAALAEVTGQILTVFGVNLERQGINLVDSDVIYVVTQDCLGWKSMAAYSALIFSSTSKYSKQLKPLSIGLISIIAVNIARITTTIYLSHIDLISFEIIHSLFWKWGLTFFVILFWSVWFHQKSGKKRS